MHWKTKQIKPPEKLSWRKGDFVYVKKFAWLPTRCQNGYTYWLDNVSHGYVALEDTDVKPGYCRTWTEWEYAPTMDNPGNMNQIEHKQLYWQLEFIIPWESRHTDAIH